MKKNPLMWPVRWIAFILCIVFFVASCKDTKDPDPPAPSTTGTILLAPDMYLLAQWEKETNLNEDFYAQLDSLAQSPSVPGDQLTAIKGEFYKKRIALYLTNKEIVDLKAKLKGPIGTIVLPPPPPPPPPPIKDWKELRTRHTIPVERNRPLAVYFSGTPNDNFQVSMMQGQQTVVGKQSVASEGVIKVELDLTTFVPGSALMNMSGFNGGPSLDFDVALKN